MEQGHARLVGRLEAFGFEPREVSIDAIARPPSWRMTRGLIAAGIGVGVAPVVALVPPHVPWLLGALIGGGMIARRRFTEYYTLRSMEGACPRCGHPVTTDPGRLTAERTVRCGSCGQDLTLKVGFEKTG